MSTRVKTALVMALAMIICLLPAIWLPWFPVIGFTVIFVFCALELYQALGRRLRPLALLPIIVGTLTGLSPIYIWIAYRNLTGWHALPLYSASFDQALVNNNAWVTSMCWLFGLGMALYAFVFILFSLLSNVTQTLLRGPAYLPNAVATSFAGLFLSAPLASVCLYMYAIPNGFRWLLAVLFSAVITDTAAYYMGRFFGRKPIVPNLSKAKTLEGFLSALFINAIIMGLAFAFLMRGSLPQFTTFSANFLFGIGYGLVMSLVCQLGDWTCSAIKRFCELKDFSKTFPGHGGMLDRVDSLTFGLPFGLIAAFFYYMIER
ncbi:MAG: phosphatidate cytidylyltransferase [Eubacteriales bacterium]|nr:phosphatidate cytidylyltransferase [Eubacteriales bacterium]